MPFKILSLDGGGAWALIEVKALVNLFGAKTKGREVLSRFDLAVANSGGSIVLGGLLEDKALEDILNMFLDEKLRRSIFQPTSSILDAGLNAILRLGPKYSTVKKLPALQRLMPVRGTQKLTDVAKGLKSNLGTADVHVLITGFDYDRNAAAFFRSAPTGSVPGWGSGGACDDVALAEAIHASSNAPVNFFDIAAEFGGSRYWDGAIAGCNNPVLAGVAEAIMLGADPRDIRALSIGTSTVRWPGPPVENPPPFVARRSQTGFTSDLGKLAGSVTDDPPDAATFLAHVMTTGPNGLPRPDESRVVRLNPMISPLRDGSNWKAPGNWSVEQLNHLAQIDLAALDPIDIDYVADYADLWLEDGTLNQPIRMHGDTLVPEIGEMFYSKAVESWTRISR